jgi:8-oxo-dGTP pyrophosphatase MutT (NUDIX family)
MLQPLHPEDLARVYALQQKLGKGDQVTLAEWLAIEEDQHHLAKALGIANEPPGVQEQFKLIRAQHDPVPLIAPRWWFHLLGLRHGSVHIVLTTPQNWVIIQRRSWEKDDSPGALDIAVSGHIGLTEPEEAAWREMSEEIGLTKAERGEKLQIIGNSLTLVDTYEVTVQRNATRNPPFIDAERRWVYTATVTTEGVARMHFADGEVTALMLVGAQELQRLNARCKDREYVMEHEIDLASGLIETLPRWIASVKRER